MALGWVTRKDVDSEANILEGGRAWKACLEIAESWSRPERGTTESLAADEFIATELFECLVVEIASI